MIEPMMIGQLASRTGLSVRTLRFYADAGVLTEDGRSAAGYRLFGPDAVARGRLIRTLRELGVGLDDIRGGRAAAGGGAPGAASQPRPPAPHTPVRRVPRGVLRAFARSADTEELQLMTDLTVLTAEERRRIVDEYLDAVFGDAAGAVADKHRMGIPELPEDPAPEQVAAWVELAALLRDQDFVASSRRMAQRAQAEWPAPDPAQFRVGQAIGEIAGPPARAGLDPASAEALAVVERLEAMGPQPPEARAVAAARIEEFTDRRVGRYWTLVGIINGWQPDQAPADVIDTWEWYGRALRAHA